MRKYLQELRRFWLAFVAFEAIGAAMWAGVAVSGDPALVTLAVLFTIGPLVAPWVIRQLFD